MGAGEREKQERNGTTGTHWRWMRHAKLLGWDDQGMPCTLRASDDCIQELCRTTIAFVKIGRPTRCGALFSGAPPCGRTRRQHRKRRQDLARRSSIKVWDSGTMACRVAPGDNFRGSRAAQASCKPTASRPQTSHRPAADVVAQQSTLAAGTTIHQRFQLPHIGRAQMFARQQGLHLFKNAMLWHGWQDGYRRTNGNTGHADGQPFRRGSQRCPTCRAATQQPGKHADQYTGP